MEISVDGIVHQYPVFQRIPYWSGFELTFEDLFALGDDGCWPVDFCYRGAHEEPHPQGSLVKLSPLLRQIFGDMPDPHVIIGFLEELRSHFGLLQPHCSFAPVKDVHLNSVLTQAGFSVRSVRHDGTRLIVDIAWSFRDGHPGWQFIGANRLNFFLREGAIAQGKWEPFWTECIEDLFWQRLKPLVPANLIECFAGPDDIENLRFHVEWNSLLLLTPQAIREKRIECVANVPEHWNSPKVLAKLLEEAGLYSRSTSRWHIERAVPTLVDAAKKLNLQ